VRVSEKLALTDQIGKVMAGRYGYEDIDAFLAEFNLESRVSRMDSTLEEYAKSALYRIDTDLLLGIAEDLQLDVFFGTANASIPPHNWKDTQDFKLFISHISKSKVLAMRLKEALDPYAISAFVAHEDIEPTKEWQQEIERALYAMDAMLALHTDGFKDSTWTQQEVGFALGRGVKVISVKMEAEAPTGLISKHQAVLRGTRRAEAVAEELSKLLSEDARTTERLHAAQAQHTSPDFDEEIPF
jgi:hypothetical protein